jgi:transcriptional regulator with XRE-family HTH domain
MFTKIKHTEFLKNLGRKIREQRFRSGITIGELAKKTKFSKSLISQIENARVSPSLPTLMILCDTLNVDFHQIFTNNIPRRCPTCKGQGFINQTETNRN